MERVIAVSLSEWVTWLQLHEKAAITAFLALVAFLGAYTASRRKMAREENSRLEHLRISLELYASATGPLMLVTDKPSIPVSEKNNLLKKLLACRAAPYATENVLAQITAFSADLDDARLPLLLKTLERESERLIAEREKLLRHMEQPSWGGLFWRCIRPALSFLFAAALFFSLLRLIQLLNDSVASGGPELQSLLYSWVQLLSVWFSLLLLYPAVLGGYRKNERSTLLRVLAITLSALALLHLAGSFLAPYIFAAQLLLFAGGFRLDRKKPRKSRPYVGFGAAAIAASEDQSAEETEP